MKPVQYFSDAYLAQARQASPEQILQFLEQFRLMQAATTMSSRAKLISLKVPEDMLALFRARCEIEGVKYQTHIKTLMAEWLGR